MSFPARMSHRNVYYYTCCNYLKTKSNCYCCLLLKRMQFNYAHWVFYIYGIRVVCHPWCWAVLSPLTLSRECTVRSTLPRSLLTSMSVLTAIQGVVPTCETHQQLKCVWTQHLCNACCLVCICAMRTDPHKLVVMTHALYCMLWLCPCASFLCN